MKEFEAKKQIITFFHEKGNSFISGEDISDALGFSRASVWKYIKKLRDDGYVVEAMPHLGYKLISVPDKIYGYDISSSVRTKIIGKKAIHYYDSITSTNDRAYELAEEGEEEGAIVLAETQSHGKGRIGRKWVSPKSGGVYMSIILRPDVETDEIPTVTLIAAAAIIKAIKKVSGLKSKMKWPNDILIGKKKVCGILTEIKAQPDRVDFLVLGIGVNVNTAKEKLPSEGTSLKIAGGFQVNRTEIVTRILEEFEKYYSKFQRKGFIALRDECKTVSSVLGKRIKVAEHHRRVEGTAVDIDEKGALIIRKDNGINQRIFSGDIVLS